MFALPILRKAIKHNNRTRQSTLNFTLVIPCTVIASTNSIYRLHRILDDRSFSNAY